LAERNKALCAKSWKKPCRDPNHNGVWIVGTSYLQEDFEAQPKTAQKWIECVIEKFGLTSEHGTAFRIIANHGVTPGSEWLMVYVGGMGGTGKSQVIKAVMDCYKSRNKSYVFVVLAPTGTAAALLHGSTYHSFLGVPIDGQTAFNSLQIMHKSRQGLMELNIISWMKSP
jgi:hypothetical protein